ncbi:MAG: hypothetical protein M1813_003892 [Trichoglossum hirsutum]|jgi:hypothetical protein|nr:MAG: hypothetical protein M1813_003892 [Trichoglossum hirsutum]
MHFLKAISAMAVFAIVSVSAIPPVLDGNIEKKDFVQPVRNLRFVVQSLIQVQFLTWTTKKAALDAAPLKSRGRTYDEIDGFAANVTTTLFGDALPPDQWKTICDGFSQAFKDTLDRYQGRHYGSDFSHLSGGRRGDNRGNHGYALAVRATAEEEALSLLPIFIAGGLLVFGGDLSLFAKKLTYLMLAIATMLAGGGASP